MNRRRYLLTSVALGVPLAGCADGDGEGTPTDDEELTPDQGGVGEKPNESGYVTEGETPSGEEIEETPTSGEDVGETPSRGGDAEQTPTEDGAAETPAEGDETETPAGT